MALTLTGFMLPAAFAGEAEAMQGAADSKDYSHYVDVSVLSVWASPEAPRNMDAPALQNPVQPRQWTESMSAADKRGLLGNLDTQALYGMEVEVLQEEGNWAKIAVEEQQTPKLAAGYPGWVPKEQITESPRFELLQHAETAQVTDPTAFLYDDRSLETKSLEISFNTRLPVVFEGENKLLVATPSDGNKWIDSGDVTVYEDESTIPEPEASDLQATAEQFMNLPYLWAGTSGFGFDCSGFTHTIYKAHGINIPRDSKDQARSGTAVERSNLQKGDLVFFAYNGGTGNIHHVGMYIGDGRMIHSPNSDSTVEKVTIAASEYAGSFHNARRYLD
ncbi:C40 family peptidase [Salibacterium halotolerans]|uniref:NlpC/P60 family protein n=1 Tax=Salibacterium halotolerans TaxID=1884432 RepID=A0A1I5X6E2_9BACI|nr:C40 family peptidase [Salibacterium halotolerans]SFQ27207.1 NlpC/P60 family protein [Salibacterium halotolerans]